jgi:hypothetical protein
MTARVRIILLVAALLAVAAHGAYWFHVAGMLRKEIDAAAQDRRHDGWQIAWGDTHLSGYPRLVRLVLDDLALAGPDGLGWRAERVAVEIDLLEPLSPRLDLAGLHQLALGPWRGLLGAQSALATIRLDAGRAQPAGVTIKAGGLSLEQAGMDPFALDGLDLAIDDLHAADTSHQTASMALALQLRGLLLPEISGLPLDRRIARFALKARLMGSLPAGAPAAALAAWSAEGGTLELDGIDLDWPPVTLDGDGTIALDAALQPLIATAIHAQGAQDFLDRLVLAGRIEPAMASAAKIMLAILARPDAKGRPTLNLPLTLQDGVLWAGQIRVMTVPRQTLLTPPSTKGPPP